MRLFLVFLFVLIHGFGSCSMAQTLPTNTQKVFEFLDSKENYIKNPYARINQNDRTFASATCLRDTSAGYRIKGVSSWAITASAITGYCEFALEEIRDPDGSNNFMCEFKGAVKGDSSLYRAQVLDASNVVLLQSNVLGNNTDWRQFSISLPCSATPKVRITQTEAGTAGAIRFAGYYGPATNIGTWTPPNELSAQISSTGAVSLQTPNGTSWISSCAITDSSLFTCTFAAGFFTSVPSCVITPYNGVDPGTSAVSMSGIDVTTSVLSFRTLVAGVKNPTKYGVKCNKTGADAPVAAIRADQQQLPNIIRYTTGSGTYTPTQGTVYIEVQMVGGGGGGGGSGTSAATNGSAGGNSTFGTSLLTANGGSGSTGPSPGVGGTATINLPAVGAFVNGSGGGVALGVSSSFATNGSGGSSFFGGSGGGSSSAAAANSGSGGGGAAGPSSGFAGAGGGAGGFVGARIGYPSGSYAYSIGAAGSAGAAGSGGSAGGAGGSGIIIITEYFSPVGAIVIPGMEPASGAFQNTAGTSIPNNTATLVPLTTALSDNQGITWDVAGVCARVQFAGYYSGSATLLFALSTYPAQEYNITIGVVSGPELARTFNFTSGSLSFVGLSTSFSGRYLAANSCVYVSVYQNSGSAKTLYTVSSVANQLTLARVGNKQ